MTFEMGQCLSCLGLGHDNDDVRVWALHCTSEANTDEQQTEREHLLNNDNTMQYGATSVANRDSYIDPENLRRQEERLARLVRHANEYVPSFQLRHE
jgi:hypothetical protein